MRQHPGTLAAAFLSTCLSFGWQYLEDSLPSAGLLGKVLYPCVIGLIYGLVVLLRRGANLLRNAAAILFSGVLYWASATAAAALVVDHGWPAIIACALAGGASALLLSAASRSLLQLPAGSDATVLAALIGTVAGIVFALAFKTHTESLSNVAIFAGYLVWQAGFALAHELVPAWWPGHEPPEIRL